MSPLDALYPCGIVRFMLYVPVRGRLRKEYAPDALELAVPEYVRGDPFGQEALAKSAAPLYGLSAGNAVLIYEESRSEAGGE